MPPVGNVTCEPMATSSEKPRNFGKDDLDALLYIVVTLLFYSMGIIIGIITYLKREQAEMEEDKMFDTYMQIRREPLNMQKKERVQKMALYLKQIEEQKADREKVNHWKASEGKSSHSQIHQHCQSCYKCTSQESPCPECNTAPLLSNIGNCNTNAATLTESDRQGGDNKKGALFLSSGSPCVYEPLTPDFKKRVAFPDHSVSDDKTVSTHTSCRAGTSSYQTPAFKSAFKRTPTSVHCPRISTSEPREIYADRSFKTPFLKAILSAQTGWHTQHGLELGDKESMELRQFAGTAGPIYLPEGESSNECGRSSNDLSLVSPSSKQEQHLAPAYFIHTHPSSQIEKLTSYLTVHSKFGQHQHGNQCLNNEETPCLTKSACILPPASSNPEATPERLEALAWAMACIKSAEGMQQQKLFNQKQQLEHCELEPHQHTRPHCLTTISGETISSPLVSSPKSQDTSPRQTSKSPQSPLTLSYKVRPHTFPAAHILRLLSEDGPVSSSVTSADSTLPGNNSSAQSQSMRPCIKSKSQNFQMTGVTKTRQLGLEWRNKTNDKRLAPRSQPERRGALFFTQRSFQKDLDSPTTSGDSKQTRPPNFFVRQDNVDSGQNRHSGKSETADPLGDHAKQFFCTSISGGTNPVPPSTTGRDRKRNQRLTSSQTLDSFTYL